MGVSTITDVTAMAGGSSNGRLFYKIYPRVTAILYRISGAHTPIPTVGSNHSHKLAEWFAPLPGCFYPTKPEPIKLEGRP